MQEKVEFDNRRAYFEDSEEGVKGRLILLRLLLLYFDLSDEKKR